MNYEIVLVSAVLDEPVWIDKIQQNKNSCENYFIVV